MRRLIFIIALVLGFGPGALPESKALTFTTIQQNGSVNKDIAVAPGELYEVSFDLVGHTTDDVRFVVSEGANVLVDESTLADGAHQYYFTAVGSTVTLTFQRLDPGTDSRMFVVNGLSFLKQEEKVCQNEVGEKQYELSDHLGNVRATISDNPDMDEAEVISAVDYYPFGMEQSGRIERSPEYRYAFNGKEKDDEMKDIIGSSYDFGERIYDPRLGRWLTVDPLYDLFPNESPYVYAGNAPTVFVDKEGETKITYIKNIEKDGTESIIALVDKEYIEYEWRLTPSTWDSQSESWGLYSVDVISTIIIDKRPDEATVTEAKKTYMRRSAAAEVAIEAANNIASAFSDGIAARAAGALDELTKAILPEGSGGDMKGGIAFVTKTGGPGGGTKFKSKAKDTDIIDITNFLTARGTPSKGMTDLGEIGKLKDFLDISSRIKEELNKIHPKSNVTGEISGKREVFCKYCQKYVPEAEKGQHSQIDESKVKITPVQE